MYSAAAPYRQMQNGCQAAPPPNTPLDNVWRVDKEVI